MVTYELCGRVGFKLRALYLQSLDLTLFSKVSLKESHTSKYDGAEKLWHL